MGWPMGCWAWLQTGLMMDVPMALWPMAKSPRTRIERKPKYGWWESDVVSGGRQEGVGGCGKDSKKQSLACGSRDLEKGI